MRFPSQIGDSLLGNEYLYLVFAVVEVRYHRDDGAYLSAFGCRRASKYRQISVACEVARAAYAVHHLGSCDVRGVYVTEDIRFESCIHCNQSQTAYDFGVVGDFSRTKYDFVVEESDILEYLV